MKWIGPIAALCVAACATVTPRPTLEHAARSGVPLERLEHGRQLFVSHCGNCHAAPAPKSHTPAEWETIVAEMHADANLDPVETAEVLAFVKALAVDDAPLAAR